MNEFDQYIMIGGTEEDNKAIMDVCENEIDLAVDKYCEYVIIRCK